MKESRWELVVQRGRTPGSVVFLLMPKVKPIQAVMDQEELVEAVFETKIETLQDLWREDND
jgi:hypothetical protein